MIHPRSIWAVEVVDCKGISSFAIFGEDHNAAKRHADANRGKSQRVFIWDMMGV